MKYWIALIIGSTLAGLLIRIPLGGAGILLLDVLLPFVTLGWLGWMVVTNQKLVRYDLWLPTLSFLFIAILSWILGGWELDTKAKIISGLHIVRWLCLGLWGWLICQFVCNKAGSKWLLFCLIGTYTVLLLFGYLQFYLVPDLSNYSTVGGYDPHIGRFLGTWMDPNFLGGVIGFTLPLLIGRWCEQSPQSREFGTEPLCKIERKGLFSWEQISLSILIALSLYGLFLTFSRSAYLAAGVGLLFFFLIKDIRIIFLGILLAAIGLATNERAQQRVMALAGTVTSIVLQDTTEIDITASHRIVSWSKTWELFEKYPVLGIGYNTYRYRAEEEGIVDSQFFSAGSADSSLLTVLTTTGVVGFGAFAWWLWRLVMRPWRVFRETGNWVGVGFVAGILSLLVHCTFVNSLLFPLILVFVLGWRGVIKER